ncbi:hypothetical protein PMAYCL1PPCAC_23251, partial [Pristionchus mayeri]
DLLATSEPGNEMEKGRNFFFSLRPSLLTGSNSIHSSSEEEEAASSQLQQEAGSLHHLPHSKAADMSWRWEQEAAEVEVEGPGGSESLLQQLQEGPSAAVSSQPRDSFAALIPANTISCLPLFLLPSLPSS